MIPMSTLNVEICLEAHIIWVGLIREFLFGDLCQFKGLQCVHKKPTQNLKMISLHHFFYLQTPLKKLVFHLHFLELLVVILINLEPLYYF